VNKVIFNVLKIILGFQDFYDTAAQWVIVLVSQTLVVHCADMGSLILFSHFILTSKVANPFRLHTYAALPRNLLPVAQDLGKDAKLSPYNTIGNEIYFYAW